VKEERERERERERETLSCVLCARGYKSKKSFPQK